MKTYDWLVVGGGITGAALSYELAKKGLSVLLLEQDAVPRNATRYSYGGLAYWSGTSDLTRQLCHEGIELHQSLAAELDADTQFRELDLVLTIDPDDDPQVVLGNYAHFAIPPKLLSVEEACALEPLLNPNAIAAALTLRHGHIQPAKTTQGYIQAFKRLGGEVEITQVEELLRKGDRLVGVKTSESNYVAANTVVCAGGLSRTLLNAAGIQVRLYFTRAELIETSPVDLKLKAIVMPAEQKRFHLEAQASTADLDALWDEPGHEPAPPILDAGAVQFLDGSLRIGQFSRVLTNPCAQGAAASSEATLREQIGKVLPALEKLPGTWYDCLVAFSSNRLPVVGAVGNVEGAYVFSGFTNPLVFAPPIARHFAHWAAGQDDLIITQLSAALRS